MIKSRREPSEVVGEELLYMINIITIHDCQFNIIYANEDAKRILGLPEIGRASAKCYDYFHGKGDVPHICPGLNCILSSESSRIKIFEPHLDKFLEIKATPLYDTRKEPIGIFHVAREMEPWTSPEELSSETISVNPDP